MLCGLQARGRVDEQHAKDISSRHNTAAATTAEARAITGQGHSDTLSKSASALKAIPCLACLPNGHNQVREVRTVGCVQYVSHGLK